jgi:lysophospholipase L1-like esterase
MRADAAPVAAALSSPPGRALAVLAVLAALAVLAVLAVGGCDGEYRRPPEVPRSPPAQVAAGPDPVASVDVDLDAGVTAEPPAEVALPEPVSVLDTPGDSLDALFAGLAAAERGDPAARVLWLFFGDSHTAGDAMTSRLRVTLQGRFGDAGRGLVAAGRPPSRYYYQRDVRYGASGRWKVSIGGYKKDPEPYGLAGLRIYGQRKGAQLWVETCSDCQAGARVAQFEILYYAAPDRGVLRYRVDDRPWQRLRTRSAANKPARPARHAIAVSDGPHRLTLEHGGGGTIDLFGVALERRRPGVIVEALGVVGRRLASLRSWDWSVIGEQLASRAPRVVVLQYGTNEADDPALDLEAMARYFDETILRIRTAAPTAAILILGPPDMATREAGKLCDRRPPDAPPVPECEWRTPLALTEIIAAQRAAAVRNRVAFFNTFAAMGGAGRIHGWFTAEPRLAFKDHVHLTERGYHWWADLLSSAILTAYDRWRAAQGLPPVPAMPLPVPALPPASAPPTPPASAPPTPPAPAASTPPAPAASTPPAPAASTPPAVPSDAATP